MLRQRKRAAAIVSAGVLAVAGGVAAFTMSGGSADAATVTLASCKYPTAAGTPSPTSTSGSSSSSTPTGVPGSCVLEDSSGNRSVTASNPSTIWVNVFNDTAETVTGSVSWQEACYNTQGGAYPAKTYQPQSFSVDAGKNQDVNIAAGPSYPASGKCVLSNVTLHVTSSVTWQDQVTAELDYIPAQSQTTSGSGCSSATYISVTSSCGSSTTSKSAGNVSGHPVHGYAGKCLDDRANSGELRAVVQLWHCNGQNSQKWVYSGGELHHGKLCLNDKGWGEDGGKMILWTCNGAANEIFIYKTMNPNKDAYILRAHGLQYCLDDPAFSKANGTQADLWKCNGGANQHWTMP